jgi:hypothetical protein
MGTRSELCDRADPPTPVPGAPWGRRIVGVVVAADAPTPTMVVEALEVTKVVEVVEVVDPGVVVVVDPGVVVVVEPGVVVVVVVDPGVVVVVVPGVVVEVVVAPAVVVVVVASSQVGTVTVLSSIVTAPPIAKTRPLTIAPVLSVIDVVARIDPAKWVVVPKVAELPTCQNTLHACAPFSSVMVLDDAVVRVEPAWKMNTEFRFPPPLRVRVPVRPMDEVDR